jgi:hypothetical protein
LDDSGAIRRAYRDGQSIRRIAREFGLSRITVRKALKHPEPVAKVSDEAWGLLAERFREIGWYSVKAFACEMPDSYFTVERRPRNVIGPIGHEYRFRDLHPSEVPPWIRTHRRLAPEEVEAMKRDIQERWGDYYDYA